MEVQIGEDDFSFECWGCLFSGGGGQGLICSFMLNFKSVYLWVQICH